MGNATVWSVGVWLTTLAFAGGTIAYTVVIWRTPPDAVRDSVRSLSIAVAAGLLIACGYLAYWGVIGVRTWA